MDAQRLLAAQVFARLVDVVRERAADVGAFVASGYSFESWMLWEWAARCWRVEAWKTLVEPRYRSLPNVRRMAYADLLVRDGSGAGVLIELGILHDWSGAKWYSADGKLACDRKKLLTAIDPHSDFMQVVVVASKSAGINTSEAWRRAFASSGCWDARTFEETVALPPSGEAIVFGWVVVPDSAKK